MNLVTDPLAFEFFRQGLLAATMVGALCGMIGVYVILRKMSYIGHGLSHSVFGGAVVAYVTSINFYVGAGLWGFLSALLINATARRRKIGADAAIGISAPQTHSARKLPSAASAVRAISSLRPSFTVRSVDQRRTEPTSRSGCSSYWIVI